MTTRTTDLKVLRGSHTLKGVIDEQEAILVSWHFAGCKGNIHKHGPRILSYRGSWLQNLRWRLLHDFIRDTVQKGVVGIHQLSTDENIVNIFTKPLSGTSLAGMKMFPWGSIDDCSIVSIFQYWSDGIDHVGIGPYVIFVGLQIGVIVRSPMCKLH